MWYIGERRAIFYQGFVIRCDSLSCRLFYGYCAVFMDTVIGSRI